jgi:3-oxoacyl-(acyl-carrier-protein) synthase
LLLSQALLDAKLGLDCAQSGDIEKMRAGVLVGTAMGGMQTFTTAIETLHNQVSCPEMSLMSASNTEGAIMHDRAGECSMAFLGHAALWSMFSGCEQGLGV